MVGYFQPLKTTTILIQPKARLHDLADLEQFTVKSGLAAINQLKSPDAELIISGRHSLILADEDLQFLLFLMWGALNKIISASARLGKRGGCDN